jgi:hypothetical protein
VVAQRYEASAPVTPEQAGGISARIAERFPDGQDRPYAWGRFNNHFRVARYRELPANRFAEACDYIATIPKRHLESSQFTLAPITPEPVTSLPQKQVGAIQERLSRLLMLFHPFSDQFADVLGISRALHGLHPRLGIKEPGFIPVIRMEKDGKGGKVTGARSSA